MSEYTFPSPIGYTPRTDTLVGCVSSKPQRDEMIEPPRLAAIGTHRQQGDAAWSVVEDKVLAALDQIAGSNGFAQSWVTVATVMKALPRGMSEDQVRVALDRLRKSGRAKKRGRGQWRSAIVRAEK